MAEERRASDREQIKRELAEYRAIEAAKANAIARYARLRRGWSRWLSARTILIAYSEGQLDAIDRFVYRRLAFALAQWARWWWCQLFLPSLARRCALRLSVAKWKVANLRLNRLAARVMAPQGLYALADGGTADDVVGNLGAVGFHLANAYKRGMSAFCTRRLIAHASRKANLEYAELNRIATLAEALLERWHRPQAIEKERYRKARAFRYMSLLRQWCESLLLFADKKVVVKWCHKRLLTLTFRGWIIFCSLPVKYDRLLQPLRDVQALGPRTAIIHGRLTTTHQTTNRKRRVWMPPAENVYTSGGRLIRWSIPYGPEPHLPPSYMPQQVWRLPAVPAAGSAQGLGLRLEADASGRALIQAGRALIPANNAHDAAAAAASYAFHSSAHDLD